MKVFGLGDIKRALPKIDLSPCGSGFDGQIFGASWVNIDSKLEPTVDSTLLAGSENKKND